VDIRLGDIVRLKKKHPCGSDEWQVKRIGADIRIECRGCNRNILLERGKVERMITAFVARGDVAEEIKRINSD